VRTDTTDFMQKLSQHAQQTGELMEEAVRQMEMLQAKLEQARAERDAAVKELQKTKSVAFKAETSNGLCSGKLTTPTYRQQGCDFCAGENKDWNNTTAHDFRLNGDGLFYNDYQFGWEGIKVNFCPMCGRRLED
jgi:hypothetical protein